MTVPNRNYQSPEYRYGFQGQEKDDEIKGNGNSVNYKYRMHDPRIGRFFAVDPLTHKYPHYTPYSFSGNKVIAYKELEGQEEKIAFWAVNDFMYNDKTETSIETWNSVINSWAKRSTEEFHDGKALFYGYEEYIKYDNPDTEVFEPPTKGILYISIGEIKLLEDGSTDYTITYSYESTDLGLKSPTKYEQFAKKYIGPTREILRESSKTADEIELGAIALTIGTQGGSSPVTVPVAVETAIVGGVYDILAAVSSLLMKDLTGAKKDATAIIIPKVTKKPLKKIAKALHIDIKKLTTGNPYDPTESISELDKIVEKTIKKVISKPVNGVLKKGVELTDKKDKKDE